MYGQPKVPCIGRDPFLARFRDAAMSSRANRKYYQRQLQCSCVLSGRRGPNFAAKDFMQLVLRLLSTAHNVLLVELAGMGVQDGDLTIVMREFSAARRHIWFTLTVKMSFWQSVPWLFFGIGHMNTDVARAIARRCLQLRVRIEANDPIEWFTFVLLFTERGFRELQDFANGADIATLRLNHLRVIPRLVTL